MKRAARAGDVGLALFAGGGIGVLFGVIMGSSTTPIIATMLGGLTTLLAAILGLNDVLFSSAKAARIGAFGVCCVCGAYMGLYVRSHNLLAPSLTELKQEYLAVGFSEQQALTILAMKEFGLSLQDLDVSNSLSEPLSKTLLPTQHHVAAHEPNLVANAERSAAGQTQAGFSGLQSKAENLYKQHNSLLFSADVALSGCDELIDTDASLPADEVLNNIELTGGSWERLVQDARISVPEAAQKAYLLAVKNSVCERQEPVMEGCAMAKERLMNPSHRTGAGSELEAGDTASDSEAWRSLSAINSQWSAIVTEVKAAGMSGRSGWNALHQIHGLLCLGGTVNAHY